MYARVTTATGSPANIEQGLQKYRDEILPALESMEGSKGTYVLVNRTSGKVVVVALWESEEALEASAAAAGSLRSQALADFSGSSPDVETFEVAAQPSEDEGQRLASAVAQAAHDLEGQVRRFAASDEVTRVRRQVETSLKSFEEWARHRGGPSGGAPAH